MKSMENVKIFVMQGFAIKCRKENIEENGKKEWDTTTIEVHV